MKLRLALRKPAAFVFVCLLSEVPESWQNISTSALPRHYLIAPAYRRGYNWHRSQVETTWYLLIMLQIHYGYVVTVYSSFRTSGILSV